MKEKLKSITIGGHKFSLGDTKSLSRKALAATHGNKEVLGSAYVDKGKGYLALSHKGIDSLHEQLSTALIDNGYMERPSNDEEKPKSKEKKPNK